MRVIPNPKLIQQYFNYLRINTGNKGDAMIVFGRQDRLVAAKAAEVFRKNNRVIQIIPTGGKGKDSGTLEVPEAQWLEQVLISEFGVPPEYIRAEKKAKNGSENARLSLKLLAQIYRPKSQLRQVVSVIHATSALRLAATLDLEAQRANWNFRHKVTPTNYPFNATLPKDQKECVGEIMRLMLYGLKGMLMLPPAFQQLRSYGIDSVPAHFEHALALGRQLEPEVYYNLMKLIG